MFDLRVSELGFRSRSREFEGPGMWERDGIETLTLISMDSKCCVEFLSLVISFSRAFRVCDSLPKIDLAI